MVWGSFTLAKFTTLSSFVATPSKERRQVQQLSQSPALSTQHLGNVQTREPLLKGRLSTIDLLIKMGYLKKNITNGSSEPVNTRRSTALILPSPSKRISSS
jgi:hypothetical protein